MLALCLRAVLISSPDTWDWTRTHALVVMHRWTLYENVNRAKIKVPFILQISIFYACIDASYRHTLYWYIDESLHPYWTCGCERPWNRERSFKMDRMSEHKNKREREDGTETRRYIVKVDSHLWWAVHVAWHRWDHCPAEMTVERAPGTQKLSPPPSLKQRTREMELERNIEGRQIN